VVGPALSARTPSVWRRELAGRAAPAAICAHLLCSVDAVSPATAAFAPLPSPRPRSTPPRGPALQPAASAEMSHDHETKPRTATFAFKSAAEDGAAGDKGAKNKHVRAAAPWSREAGRRHPMLSCVKPPPLAAGALTNLRAPRCPTRASGRRVCRVRGARGQGERPVRVGRRRLAPRVRARARARAREPSV
jgi:hypothetical protein